MIDDIDILDPVADHPLNRSLVSWWLPLPHLTGGRRLWDLRKKNHGTLTNLPTDGTAWRGGQNGFGSLAFTGSTQVVNCGNDASLRLSSQVTLAVAFRIAAWSGGYDNLVGKEQASAPYMPFSLRNELGSFQFLVNGSAVSASLPSAGDWHLAVGTYDGAAKTLYVDGRQSASSAESGSLLDAAADFTIGDSYAYTGRAPTSGLIAGVWLYASALSAPEVAALYEQHLRGHPDTLRRLTRRVISTPAAPPAGLVWNPLCGPLSPAGRCVA